MAHFNRPHVTFCLLSRWSIIALTIYRKQHHLTWHATISILLFVVRMSQRRLICASASSIAPLLTPARALTLRNNTNYWRRLTTAIRPGTLSRLERERLNRRLEVEVLARGVPLRPRIWQLVSKNKDSLGENCMILWQIVLTHYQSGTQCLSYRRTERTATAHIVLPCNGSCSKNRPTPCVQRGQNTSEISET